MNQELVQDYLTKAGMDASQAEVLSRILSEMESRLATKEDLTSVKTELTWRMIAVVGFFSTVVTLFNAFLA